MKALTAYNTYEDFEADIARELGLTMSLQRLREVEMSIRRPRPLTARNSGLADIAVPVDFESRYKACKTPTERRAFVKTNRAEARKFLQLGAAAPTEVRSSKAIHRRLK